MFHFRVRNENGWCHGAKPPKPNIQKIFYKLYKFPNRNQTISTPRLNPLPDLHLEPIKVVICDLSMISNLGAGFSLRCFQRLSHPDIATRRCPLAGQPAHQRSVHSDPLVQRAELLKNLTPARDRETNLSHDGLNPAHVTF